MKPDYLVVSIDFQKFGTATYESENSFALSFADCFLNELDRNEESDIAELSQEMETLRNICRSRDGSYAFYERS